MSSIMSTLPTLISGAYTMYYMHSYIPYGFIWNQILIPTISKITSKRKYETDDIDYECYEIVKTTRDSNTGVVTKYMILKSDLQSEVITNNEPVWF